MRLSTVQRYTGTGFTRPFGLFTPDGNTAALYHLDEGTGDAVGDASGGGSHGVRRYGGNPAGPEWSSDSAPLDNVRRVALKETISSLTRPVAIANAGDGRLFIVEADGRILAYQVTEMGSFTFLDTFLDIRRPRQLLRGARAPRPRLPPELREQRPLLRVLHESGRWRRCHRALPGAVSQFQHRQFRLRAHPPDHRALDVRQPRRRWAGLRARRVPVRCGRRRGRRRRPPSAAARASGPSWARSSGWTSMSPMTRHRTTRSRPTTRLLTPRARGRRSGLGASATPGASASTGSRAISSLRTSARTTSEEVNFQPASSPGGETTVGHAWKGPPVTDRHRAAGPGSLILPIMEYSHGDGCSITGGYRYRGTAIPALHGAYVFGDFCSKKIWLGVQSPSGNWTRADLLGTNLSISTFGEDATGEVYVAALEGSCLSSRSRALRRHLPGFHLRHRLRRHPHGPRHRHQHRLPPLGRQQRLPPRLPLVPGLHPRHLGWAAHDPPLLRSPRRRPHPPGLRSRLPASAGTYTLKWDMVREFVTWFSGQGVAPAAIPITVGLQLRLVPTAPPTRLPPSPPPPASPSRSPSPSPTPAPSPGTPTAPSASPTTGTRAPPSSPGMGCSHDPPLLRSPRRRPHPPGLRQGSGLGRHLHPQVGHGPGVCHLVLRPGRGSGGHPHHCGLQLRLVPTAPPTRLPPSPPPPASPSRSPSPSPTPAPSPGTPTAPSASPTTGTRAPPSSPGMGCAPILPSSVPGGGLTLQASVKAPASAGTYTLKWDMVREFVTWFSGQGVATTNLTIARR